MLTNLPPFVRLPARFVYRSLKTMFQVMDAGVSVAVHQASRLVPRNPRIWLFSALGGKFADNAKHFFIHVSENRSDLVRPIWISRRREVVAEVRNLGYEAYWFYSPTAWYFILRGGLFVFTHYVTDISWALSGGAQKLNLWHAIAFKKTNYDNVFDRARNPRGALDVLRTLKKRLIIEKPAHWLLATSPEVQQEFMRIFRMPRENIIISGYPRNDLLLQPERAARMLPAVRQMRDWLAEAGAVGTAVYMPTHRRSEDRVFELVDFEELNRFLQEKRILLLIKPHPMSRMRRMADTGWGNIRTLASASDPYPLLAHVDCLISDYSSILFDFLLTDRPQIFFPFDMEEYIRATRELCYDYEQFVPGPIVRDQAGLQTALEHAIRSVDDGFSEQRAALRSRFFESTKPDGSERLYHIVTHRLAIEPAGSRTVG